MVRANALELQPICGRLSPQACAGRVEGRNPDGSGRRFRHMPEGTSTGRTSLRGRPSGNWSLADFHMRRHSRAISRERADYKISHLQTSCSFTVSRLISTVANHRKMRTAAKIMRYPGVAVREGQ